jgi:hypothetical protein
MVQIFSLALAFILASASTGAEFPGRRSARLACSGRKHRLSTECSACARDGSSACLSLSSVPAAMGNRPTQRVLANETSWVRGWRSGVTGGCFRLSLPQAFSLAGPAGSWSACFLPRMLLSSKGQGHHLGNSGLSSQLKERAPVRLAL